MELITGAIAMISPTLGIIHSRCVGIMVIFLLDCDYYFFVHPDTNIPRDKLMQGGRFRKLWRAIWET
jgi:hypothetical protein